MTSRSRCLLTYPRETSSVISRFSSRSLLRADTQPPSQATFSGDAQDVDDEDQGGVRRDVLSATLSTVAEGGRDDQHDAAAELDALQSLDPTLDELTLGQCEGRRVLAVGLVEGSVALA